MMETKTPSKTEDKVKEKEKGKESAKRISVIKEESEVMEEVDEKEE